MQVLLIGFVYIYMSGRGNNAPCPFHKFLRSSRCEIGSSDNVKTVGSSLRESAGSYVKQIDSFAAQCRN